MSLRTNSLWLRMSSALKNMRISTKLSLVYAAIIAVLLLTTSSCTIVGVYYALYHQAETEVRISTNVVRKQMSDPKRQGKDISDGIDLVPGVILKITDGQGNLVHDSDPRSKSLSEMTSHDSDDPPFWASNDFKIIRMGRFLIYYRECPLEFEGKEYTMHFFKAITAETELLALIQKMLLAEVVVGLLLALMIGYFVSQRFLHPIRVLNETAKSIEVNALSTRIEVSPSRDELAELTVTLNHMLDRIQEGFILQQRFVSDAAHELRTPVTVIKGYADMLIRWGAEDKDTLQEGLQAIKSESADMEELIEKLLFLARADQKRQIINKAPLHMDELVDDIYKKMKLTATKHTVELLRNDAGVIMADKVTMKQMLRIFLENSVKYTPEGGHLTIESRRLPGFLKIELADDGIGIAKEDQEKIFGRFYRVDSSRTKAVGQPSGTGLGLSIARWIADSHDIGISVESELGCGTKFILMIPLYEEDDIQ